MNGYPKPPFPTQSQSIPGKTARMDPKPDHGESSYKGSGRLAGKRAVITGGDSGIGRAVAIAFAREGADVLVSYLDEHEDAAETKHYVEEAGRKAVLVPGDIQDAAHCRAIIDKAVSELGGIDILVNNAAHQNTFKDIAEISDEEWELTFKVNIHAMFYLTKAAVEHMAPGSSIINTTSVNADMPNPTLLAYATTKGAIQNFTGGLAQMLAEKDSRQCRCAGPDLDAAYPIHHAGRERYQLRQADANEAAGAAGGTRNSLRHACRSAVELCFRYHYCSHRRQAVHLVKRGNVMTQENEKVARTWELMEKILFCMLSTRVGEDIRSRPMAAHFEPIENAIYFLTDVASHKDEEIERRHNVGLSFADTKGQKYVSVTGDAEVSNDRERIRELFLDARQSLVGKRGGPVYPGSESHAEICGILG